MGQHVTHLFPHVPTNCDALKWNCIWSQGACCLIFKLKHVVSHALIKDKSSKS